MTKQTVPDLKELFKQAAEIAKQVPDSMQVAAFNRAVDLLTGGAAAPPPAPARTPRRVSRASGKTTDLAEAGTSVAELIEQIDSTQHPGVRTSANVLDRALMILQIARTELQVDGLGSSTIAQILTDKFRVNTTDSGVRMALSRATHLVNRVPRGKGFIYRIMGPGEDHLSHLNEAEPRGSATPRPPKPRTSHGKSRGGKKGKQEAASPAPKSSNASASASRKKGTAARVKKAAKTLGTKAAIMELIQSGYFATARTGPEVKDHLRTKRGFDFGVTQLQVAMLRLVRESMLERDPNADGNYEYKRP